MFVMMIKPSYLCLLAFLAVQVSNSYAKPSSQDEGSGLVARGMFDVVTDPLGALNNARSAGRSAVLGTVSKGVELATGINPSTILELPKTMAKTAIRGTRRGTEVTADATDRTLDGVLDIHDQNKKLLQDYVIPVAPTMVGNAINSASDHFDSTVENMKDHVQNGKEHVVNRLNDMESWVERGGSAVSDAVKGGVETVGNVGRTTTGWLGSWIPGWSSAAPEAGPVAASATTSGRAGRRGRNGRDGQNGQNGQSGQNGQNGQDGLAGQAGQAGQAVRTGLSRFLPW